MENVLENSRKLTNALVIKVFGDNIPFYVINSELRRQWSGFGNFRLTMLGKDWVLCSCENAEIMDSILYEGPWFVKGHIVGIDKWTTSFSTNSLKGLSALVWIRLPNLPLYCWDDINICRIASLVGKPFLLDGNMIQWNRREFARICVRINLDEQLPLGVWVEGDSTKFYQRVEYEKVSKLCFKCCKIGHLMVNCPVCKSAEVINKTGLPDPVVNSDVLKVNSEVITNVDPEEHGYGPWMQV
ncbi:uncharacterized protein LOC110103492, partial [Dendrobium catenatum]|uniref:uncharacterized protein LOC110103492 n=1 Tax=Dendrobium catenatum TaxID=906689 RepID=UPI00109F764B